MASEPAIFMGQTTITGTGTYISASTANVTQQTYNTSSQKEVRRPKAKVLRALADHAAPAALHNSGEVSDPPKCHPGTRVDVLSILMTWAFSTTYVFPIRWLNGPAGAGKSAIMRTLAEMLVEQGLLLASFFFFRSDGSRNTAERLISTIAYQLCLNISPLQPHIERVIESNPLIFKTSLSTQIQSLVIEPFLRYFYDPNSIIITPLPRIILIDGLDECEGHGKQTEILETLCRMVKTIPVPIVIVVASRPEHQIRMVFELGTLSQVSSRVTLDDSFNPDRDIRAFYEAEVADIRSSHPTRSKLDKDWPTEAIIEKLVLNASGQFIYASTIIKFIKSIRHHPATRLQIILGLADQGTSKPFQQLDLLYAVVFQNIDPDALPDALRVLGIVLTHPPSSNNLLRHYLTRKSRLVSGLRSQQPPGLGFQSPDFLDHLLGFPLGHVRSVLVDLESLLTMTADRLDIRIFHTSLADFLFDKSRATDFFIDRGLVYADIASKCIEFFWGCKSHHLEDRDLDNLLGRYVKQQIEVSLQNATPTDNLRHSIANFDMKKLTGSSGSYHAYEACCVDVPKFLKGVRESRFSDAQELCQIQLVPFRNIINTILVDLWFEDNIFELALLIVLALALTGEEDFKAIDFLNHVLPPRRPSISIFPGVNHLLEKGREGMTMDYDGPLLASVLLDVIDSPNGLLHQPKGQAGCNALTVHLLQEISRKKYIVNARQSVYSKSEKDFMEYVLPFLLNASLVQQDLSIEVERIQSDRSSDGAYRRSKVIAGAIDQYIQRVAKEGGAVNALTKGPQELTTEAKRVQPNASSENTRNPRPWPWVIAGDSNQHTQEARRGVGRGNTKDRPGKSTFCSRLSRRVSGIMSRWTA